MGKILQILIIENRDLAHAQTFCTRVDHGYKITKRFTQADYSNTKAHKHTIK